MTTMTQPDTFEETLVFFRNTAFIAYREPQTGAIYFPVDSILPHYGFASTESFFTNDYLLDALNSFRQQVYQEPVREVWVENKTQPLHLIAQLFLEEPPMQALWQADPASKPVPRPRNQKPEKSKWLCTFEQEVWSEPEFTYLLAGVFMDYGVTNQRTARLMYINTFAVDERTPSRWRCRLQQLLEWAANHQRTEVHLSDLTRIEKSRIDPALPYSPLPNL